MLTALTLASASSTASAQSGFTRQRNSFYGKLGYSFFRSSRFFNGVGVERETPAFTQQSLPLYAEYGIIDALDVIVSVPLLRLNRFEQTTTAAGFGDMELSLKGGHSFGPVHLAATLTADLPTGNDAATAYDELNSVDVILPTGDGEFNLITTLAASFSINAARMWINTYVAYNLRTQGFTDQIRFGAEVGHFLAQVLYLQVRFRAQLSTSEITDFSKGFLFGEGTEYFAIGAGVTYPIPRTPIAIGVDFDIPVALQQNLYSGPYIGVGVSYEFRPPSPSSE